MSLGLDNSGLLGQFRLPRLGLRLVVLAVGLTGFGASLAFIIRAGLGVAPWDVLGVAIADRTGLTIGTVIVLTSFAVLVLWIPLRQSLGIATIANALWVGVACDLTLAVLPEVTGLSWRVALLVAGVVLNAVFDAVYIGAQLGSGPRDGLMTGLHRRTGRPIWVVRLVLELTVLAAGWALGGPLGVGTVLYAFAMGPIVHAVLPHVLIPVRHPTGSGAGVTAGEGEEAGPGVGVGGRLGGGVDHVESPHRLDDVGAPGQ